MTLMVKLRVDLIPWFSALSSIIILDFLIANEDRHTNNFGFIRNAETLNWIGMAPLFGNGSSFGFDKLTSEISSNSGFVCKPFKNKHREQLKLALPFHNLNLASLDTLTNIAGEFLRDKGGKYVDEERAREICKALALRILTLKNLAKGE